jgi:flagellar biosynthesis protein FlhF
MTETLTAADPITVGSADTKTTATADTKVKTYRGKSIEELLPRIRAELGAEAVITSRREGLVGGIGGFFQKRCVEVDARPGGPRIDVYDEGDGESELPPAAEAPATVMPSAEAVHAAAEAQVAAAASAEQHPVRNDAATREGLATPQMQRLVGEAKPFADLLEQMAAAPTAEPSAFTRPQDDFPRTEQRAPEPIGEGLPAPGVPALAEPEVEEVETEPEPKRISNLREGMVATGLGTDQATAIVDAVVRNVAPFSTPGRLKTLVRNELSLRLPIVPAPGPGRRRLAVVGASGTGKTAAVARIAAAHAAVGQDVACLTVEPADGGAALRALLEGSGVSVQAIGGDELAVALLGESAELVLVDTPGASAGAANTVETLAATLATAGLDEIHIAVRAGTASPAAVEMLETLRPLGPNRILVTAAADTTYIGAVVDVAIRTALPIHYVAETVVEIAPADPRALASKVVR